MKNKELKTRTIKQNSALWQYYETLAETLNESGLDMRTVLKPSIDIPWSKQSIHDYLWKPVQDAYLDKKSTTELNTDEVSKVYDILHRHLVEKFGSMVELPQFPSQESLIDYED